MLSELGHVGLILTFVLRARPPAGNLRFFYDHKKSAKIEIILWSWKNPLFFTAKNTNEETDNSKLALNPQARLPCHWSPYQWLRVSKIWFWDLFNHWLSWIRGRSRGDGDFSRTSPSSSEVCCNILKKKVPFYVVSRICRARFRLQLHIANCVSRRVGLLCPRLLLFRDLRMDELHPETNTQWFYDCKYSIRPVATLKFPDRGH